MTASPAVEVLPGSPTPLGAHWDGTGTNFALWSAGAHAVDLCLFDPDGAEHRHPLTESTHQVWHGRVTGIGLGYSLAVNQLSTLLFDFNAANSASADDDTADPDRSRLDFTAQYTREFTEVVAASVGYTLTQSYEDPTDATSNRFFFQIGRSFVTGF